jgi:hypothetical protein
VSRYRQSEHAPERESVPSKTEPLTGFRRGGSFLEHSLPGARPIWLSRRFQTPNEKPHYLLDPTYGSERRRQFVFLPEPAPYEANYASCVARFRHVPVAVVSVYADQGDAAP